MPGAQEGIKEILSYEIKQFRPDAEPPQRSITPTIFVEPPF